VKPDNKGKLIMDDAVEKRYLDDEIKSLRTQLGEAEKELARIPTLEMQLADFERVNEDLLQLTRELESRQADYDELVAIAERYSVVVESTSWSLTRPLRDVMAVLRRLFS
jgi:SMC interacting uncharacterized protein involved in chromosome segregation